MKLDSALSLTIRRLRWIRGLAGGERTFLIAAITTVAVAALGRLTNSFVFTTPVIFGAPLVASVMGFLIAAFSRSPSRTAAATALDQRLGLDEVTSTATYFAPGTSEPQTFSEEIATQAERRLATVNDQDVRAAFRTQRPVLAFIAAGIVVLGAVVIPRVPAILASKTKEAPLKDDLPQQRQAAREAARRLKRDAKKIEQIAELKKLERTTRAARRLTTKAERMVAESPDKKSALSQLNKMRTEMRQLSNHALGRSQDRADNDQALAKAAQVAGQLNEADAKALSRDLEAFRSEMAAEAKSAREAGRAPKVDINKLEALQKRADALAEAMKQLEKLLAENPALKERLEESLRKQQELLKKMRDELERFGGC